MQRPIQHYRYVLSPGKIGKRPIADGGIKLLNGSQRIDSFTKRKRRLQDHLGFAGYGHISQINRGQCSEARRPGMVQSFIKRALDRD